MKKLLLTSLLFSSATAFAAPFVVKDIRVEGVSPAVEPLVIAQLPVRVGQRATDLDIANVVRSLYLKGTYSDVQAKQQGNTLVIQVVEHAVISELSIEGNKAIPTEALQQNLLASGLVKGEILNQEKLQAFREELTKYYESVGRYNVQVETVVNLLPNNRADVKLQISENDVILVKEIHFIGNHKFDEATLIKQLDLQPNAAWWNFLASSRFDQQKLGNDVNALRNFYLNNGYAKFILEDVITQVSDDKKTMNITFKVNEGEQYKVGSARIVGDTAGLSEQLNLLLKAIPLGEQFKGSDVGVVEDGIKSALGNKGFANPSVEVTPSFDDQNKIVDLTYVVDAGHRYYVRDIRFEGNDRSADSTLRQEMRQQEGTWFSASLMQLGKLRLDRTGFFESVDSRTELVPGTHDQIDVIYKVKERNTGSINFGIGYGTESGLNYQASIKQDNFLGKGSSISLGGSRNDYGTTINLSYNEPYFTKDGVSLGGSIFYETYDSAKNKNSASYARTTYGGDLTLGFPVDENNSYYLGVGYTYNNLKNIQPEYTRALYLHSLNVNKWTFKTQDIDFKFGWNYNNLNKGVFPTKGVRAGLHAAVTAPGSDNKYYKVNLDAVGYYPLTKDERWVISGKTSLNYANGFAGKKLPFYQYYTAGGIGTLRGFGYGSVGPKANYIPERAPAEYCVTGISIDPKCYTQASEDVVGGNAMAVVGAELIMPTPFLDDKYQQNVRTSLFVDAASVWNTNWTEEDKQNFNRDYNNPRRVRVSTGVSLQWQSPIGPLVFSYARPLKSYKNDDKERFQFSIGGSF